MLRKLSIALLASTFLCAVPERARAEPITLSILAAIGVTGLSATAVSAITIAGTLALSIGASLLQSAFTKKPEAPASGTTLQTQYGGAVPRQAIVGEQATNGHLVYANVYGSENKVLQAVYVIGDGLHDSLTGIWVNGKLCTLELSPDAGVTAAGGIQYVVPEFHDGFQDLFSVRFFPGSWDQLADPYLVGDANPAGRWTVNHRGRGICYASITQGWNEELGLTGYPDIRFQVKGLRFYDSREDSTNGGDGPQTWGSQDTYEWSDNPSVAEYNYRRGIFINDQCILGMDVLPADLILPMYVAASNDNDEEVALKEGGTEKRYRVGMTISADRQHSETLDVIRNAMAGFTLERAGQFGPLAGVAQIPDTDFTITDDDWEVGEKREHSKWRTRSEITTAVHGRFSDPAQKWEAVSFAPRESSVRDAAVGERLSQDIDLTQVSSSSQAQRIAEIQARRSMLGRGSGVLPSRFIPLQPGDWVPFDSARHGVFTALITGVTIRPDHKVAISYDVIASNVYSWTPAGDELDPPSYGESGQPGTIILAASGMSAVGVSMPGAGGLVRPGIRFTWTPIGDPSVDRIDFEIRKQGDTEVIPFPANFPSAGSGVATSGIQAATLYEYQHKLSTTPVRETPWIGWFEVTSGLDEIVQNAAGVIPGGLFFEALEQQIVDKLAEGERAFDLAITLRDSVSSVEAVRVQALQTGLVEPGLFQQIDALGQLAVKLALQAERTESMSREIGAEYHNGRWVLRGVQDTQNAINAVSIVADINTATIALSASRTELNQAIANVAAGLAPAVGWNWNSTVEGWTVSNGTLTPGAGYVDFAATGAGAYMQSPVIAVDANVYKVVRFNAVRTTGSGWGVALSWGPGHTVQQAFVIPDTPGSTHEIALDLSSVPEWAGTITNLRVYLANGTTVRFSVGQIGNYALGSGLFGDLQGQITELSFELDATAGSIAAKADQVTVDEHGVTLVSLSDTIDLQTGQIAQRALVADLTDAVDRISTAETQIDAFNNIISFTISQVQTPALVEMAGLAALHGALSDEATAAAAQALNARAHHQLSTKITDQGEVISQQLIQLDARGKDVEAAIFLERMVRRTDDEAEARQRLLLAASHDAAIVQTNASLAEEINTRATAIAALVSRASTLEVQVQTPTTGLLARMTIVETTKASLDDLEVEAERIEDLEVTIDTPAVGLSARMQNVETTKANASDLTAVAERTDTLETTINTPTTGITARVTSVEIAATSPEGSVAQAINQVAINRNRTFRQTSAPTASAVGDIWYDTDDNNKLWRWDGGSWVDTRDAGIAANATAIGVQELRVDDVEGTLSGSFTVLLDVNGHVAGIRLQNNGAESAFIINATDVIALGTITAPLIAALAINSGHINAGAIKVGNMVVSNLIVTDHLQVGAASARVYATHGATVNGTGGTWNSVVSKAIPTTSGSIEIKYASKTINIGVADAAQPSLSIRILVDDIVRETFQWLAFADPFAGGGSNDWSFSLPMTLPIIAVTGLSNGSHTVAVEANGINTWTIGAGYLSVDELRKAAT